jgi:hypothetical protein
MSIALTQNYVSKSNLPDVLRFLKTKPQQISGCRDRREAIQPDAVLGKFESSLRKERSDLLDQSLIASEKGWQCAAWKDDDNLDGNNGPMKQKTSVLERAKLSSNENSNISGPDSSNVGGFSFSFL